VNDEYEIRQSSEVKQLLCDLSLIGEYVKEINNMAIYLRNSKNIAEGSVKASAKAKEVEERTDKCISTQKKAQFLFNSVNKALVDVENDPEVSEQEKRSFKNLQLSLQKQYSESIDRFQTEQLAIRRLKQESTIREAELLSDKPLSDKDKEAILHNPMVL
jgi:hypothetical protein